MSTGNPQLPGHQAVTLALGVFRTQRSKDGVGRGEVSSTSIPMVPVCGIESDSPGFLCSQRPEYFLRNFPKSFSS